MSWESSGCARCGRTCRPWPSTWDRSATRRPGSSATPIYCSYDSGLDRGFTHYRDYVLDKLNAARTVRSVNESLKTIGQLGRFLPIPGLTLLMLSHGERKGADVVNREFLDWLSRRRQPRRPFFAFLNYVDAHSPYLLPPGGSYRLGSAPWTDADLRFLAEGWTQADKRRIPVRQRLLAIDAYDNCLAYLDERLGELIDDLQRRGVLDQTLVIVTADHGEGLGEHGLFDHGESLYRTEIRVPLLIVLPADRGRSPGAVAEFVSLRDIATTIADFVRPGTKSPFPGRSLLSLGPRARRPPPPPLRALTMTMSWCSPSWRRPIRPIRTRVDRPPIAARSISLAEGGLRLHPQ